MKKILLLTTLAGVLITPANNNNEQSSAQVFICTGASAKTYHSQIDCRGIRGCKGAVKKVTIEEAKKTGRRECKICYK